MNDTYEQLMEELETLRRKYIGGPRTVLDKIWILLTNQQIQLEYYGKELAESRRENDIHIEALKLMHNYEQKAVENTTEKIRKALKERLDENFNPFDNNELFEITYIDCCETIDEVCDEVKGVLGNA